MGSRQPAANVLKPHSDASPSSAEIWLNCPASVTKARGRQRVPTPYTREGTAAHLLAELRLKGGKKLPDHFMVDGERVSITPEMEDVVDTYVQYVKTMAPASKRIEQRVQITTEGEIISGTVDAYFIAENAAEIVDFKYGQGVPVAPDSPQLKLYALGVLNENPFDEITNVFLTIVQPRIDPDNPVNSIPLPVTQLLDWEKFIVRPALAKIEAGDMTETAGSHCKWCVRAGECRTLAALAQTNAKVAFGDTPPDPDTMSNDELGVLLDYAQMIVDWVTKVRGEASQRIDHGQYVPGWKLVPKRAARKWEKPDEAIAELVKRGIDPMNILRIETIGVVEKVMKRARVAASVIDPFTIKQSSGTTLVSEKDGREAIDNSAQAVFGSDAVL